MTIWNRIKSKPVKTLVIEVDGEKLVIRGMKRSEKNAMIANSTNKRGDVDNVALEGRFLAFCVCECDDAGNCGEPVQPDFRQWDDVPSDFAGPCIKAVREVCGLDDDDLVRHTEKKSEATGSCD